MSNVNEFIYTLHNSPQCTINARKVKKNHKCLQPAKPKGRHRRNNATHHEKINEIFILNELDKTMFTIEIESTTTCNTCHKSSSLM